MTESLPAEEPLDEQARCLEQMLPRLMRSLFPLESDFPALDLPLAQLRVCTMLQSGPRSLTSLAEELSISVSAATQNADRLERAGMVTRTAAPGDRRVKHLELTEEGRRTMDNRRNRRVARARQTLEQMTEAERSSVLSAVRQLIEAARPGAALGSPDGDDTAIRVGETT